MTDKTKENTPSDIDVPDDLWPEITDGVAKVVLTGVGASALPPDIFLKALKDNGIINDIKTTKVNIPKEKESYTDASNTNTSYHLVFACRAFTL